MVEFALVLPLFLVMILGIVDLGRGIYMFNGVSQAAREIARSASVHPGSPLGSSSETLSVIAVQQGLVPGLQDPIFHCERLNGTTVPGDGAGGCAAPNVVRVEAHAPFEGAAILGFLGPFDLKASSSNQVQ